MFALIAAAVLAAADVPPASGDAVAIQQEYQQARAAAGRSPDDQVRLAYWCEAHGLTAERLRHLAQAVIADPNHAAARGLLGLVARADRWARPDAVAEQVRADVTLAATLQEYDRKRSAAAYTADGQQALARWADEHGLKDQARAHYTAAVRLDPRRDAAWKKLGYRKHDGRWTTDAEVAAARADAEAQKQADHKWKPLLERSRADLARPSKRGEAEAGLLSVTDPRAVPSVGKVFGASPAHGPLLVQLLGQIDAPTASQLLAQSAMFHPLADTRRMATETLRHRDPREYANLLVQLLHKPIAYEVKPVNGPGSPGILFVEGDRSNVKRLYEPQSLIRPNDRITVDRFGQPVVERRLGDWSSGRVNNEGEVGRGLRLVGINSTVSDSFGTSSIGLGTLNVPNEVANDPTTMANWNQLLQNAGSGNQEGVAAAVKDLAVSAQKMAPGQAQTLSINSPVGRSLAASRGLIFGSDAAVRTTAQFSLAQVLAEQQRSALMSQRQLENDVARVEARNRSIAAVNDRAISILNSATGASLPAEPTVWQGWWVNLLGYAQVAGQTEQNPTFVEVIPSGYQPEVLPTNVITQTISADIADCFGAGTLVQTMTGPRVIERLRVGDLVLTQDTGTGTLSYQPVLVVHHNPPAATFRVQLGADLVAASQFHRFWVAGRGWVMARDLKAGDLVRTLGGVRAVNSVGVGPPEPVFNLDIAEHANFFAGSAAVLVHDNTMPDVRLVPFDLPTADAKVMAAR